MSQSQRIGLLEIIQYVLAIVLVVAAVAWNQYLVPVLVACVVATPYAIWSRLQDIEQRSAPPRQEPSVVPGGETIRQRRASKRSVTETATNGRKYDLHLNGALNGVPSSAMPTWEETLKEPVGRKSE
ncbi:hypothetical protein [Candidatus Nitrospira inopinata]|uniref:Uncharacterized protein n=1 Tax=Candidatus Nitrospira inopinata TaxID=1715989 RepID=A0A0S4KT70_9BACT|nr:hypothetical protein [Candidatus Nitrospira inopinata]CUQ65606.1 protein of unknown function [Candidatus Nitrospira inopinata]